MAERWARSNETGCGLYLDGKAVGFMDTPELAAQVVETMNRVGRLLDEVRPVDPDRRRAAESGRERSPATGGTVDTSKAFLVGERDGCSGVGCGCLAQEDGSSS